MYYTKSVYIVTIIGLMLSGSFSYGQTSVCLQAQQIEDLEDDALNALLEICEAEIDAEKEKLSTTKIETQSRERDVRLSEQSIKKSATYIRSREIEIRKIISSISQQKTRISQVETKADQIQNSIANLVRKKNALDDSSFIEAVFSKQTLSSFFADISDIDTVQSQLQSDYGAYHIVKQGIIEEQELLEEEQSRQRELSAQKELEKVLLQRKQEEQKFLVSLSKEQEKEYEQLIQEKEQAKKQLRSRLFTIASGEKISFGDAYDIIAPFERDLGIDAAFILAVLFQESGWGGQIGGNIGQCFYNQYNPHGGSRNGYQVMSASQQDAFLEIMDDLSITADQQPVSCPIPTDGAYGGAMGPAQFIPNTWAEVRKQAAGYLGVDPTGMSPFINRDAFVASGTYLRNHYYSTGCSDYAVKFSHIRSQKSLREKCAAAKYYAGGGWWNFRNSYGESVQQRANRFRSDIATLNE